MCINAQTLNIYYRRLDQIIPIRWLCDCKEKNNWIYNIIAKRGRRYIFRRFQIVDEHQVEEFLVFETEKHKETKQVRGGEYVFAWYVFYYNDFKTADWRFNLSKDLFSKPDRKFNLSSEII